MKFDDFSYKVYNPYILVQDKDVNKPVAEDDEEEGGKSAKKKKITLDIDRDSAPSLSQKMLENAVMPDYEFGPLSVKSEDQHAALQVKVEEDESPENTQRSGKEEGAAAKQPDGTSLTTSAIPETSKEGLTTEDGEHK
jgi:hypothetical protein